MYKFRHYSAELGRWPSRDPLGDEAFLLAYAKKCNEGVRCSIERKDKLTELREEGQRNIYMFVGNMPLSKFDRLGLRWNWQQSVCKGLCATAGACVCGVVTAACAKATVVTIGGLALPCVKAVPMFCAAATGAAVVCSDFCEELFP